MIYKIKGGILMRTGTRGATPLGHVPNVPHVPSQKPKKCQEVFKMKDKIKEILIRFFDEYSRALGHPEEVIKVENDTANQILSLFPKAGEDGLLPDEERRRRNEIYTKSNLDENK